MLCDPNVTMIRLREASVTPDASPTPLTPFLPPGGGDQLECCGQLDRAGRIQTGHQEVIPPLFGVPLGSTLWSGSSRGVSPLQDPAQEIF